MRAVAALLIAGLLAGCGLWTETMPNRGWPIEVQPDLSGSRGVVVVSGEESFGGNGGLEGNQPFLRATDRFGTIVLEQHFEWPGTEQSLPVGSYTVRVYALSCSGMCNNLDQRDLLQRCHLPVTVAEASRTVIGVSWAAASSRCHVLEQ